MSATAPAHGTSDHGSPDHGHEPARRDFLKLVAASSAAIGVGALAWPLIDSMNPASDVLALSSVEFDLAPVPVGQAVTIVWRGKPIFVRHRSDAEVKTAEGVKLADLIDPMADSDRVKAGHAQWLVVVGICTHLGCVPLGNKPTDPRGDFGGWFCPCHGSQYDVSGRVRHGPAPANLALPPYAYLTDSRIKIG